MPTSPKCSRTTTRQGLTVTANPAAPGDLLTTPGAANYLSEVLNQEIKPRALERIGAAYCIVNGRRTYRRADLDTYVANLLATAPRRRVTSRSNATVREEAFA